MTTRSAYEVFHQLQQLNSDSVFLLLEGRSEEALEGLARCATAIRGFLVSSAEMRSAQSIFCMESLKLRRVSLDEVMYPFDYSERVSPDNCFKLYRFVYFVDGQDSSPGPCAFRRLLATVLYNMAIISHESVHGGVRPDIVGKVRPFYELSLAMLALDSKEINTGNQFDVTPLKLALHNNLGYIYAFFYNREGTIFCQNQLWSLLTTIDQEKLHTSEYSFFRSVLPSQPQHHMSKAAAA